jgi:regulator of cell morphogenesis and NO signaling
MQTLPPRSAQQALPPGPREGSLEALIESVVAQHAHARSELQRLEALAASLSARDGELPGLTAVLECFAALDSELRAHMTKEEAVVFPYIVALEVHPRVGRNLVRSPFGVLERPLKAMLGEQSETRWQLSAIRTASNAYTPPPGAPNSVKAFYSGLEALEEALEEHGRLETEVLFPRAIELEQRACS